MDVELFQILDPGFGATVQDRGRVGWRRFGVPPSGAMDDHAAGWANRLLDNSPDAPLLELLLQGARFKALRDWWIAVTGAEAEANVPTWRALHVKAGDVIQFPHNHAGVWLYLGVAGGIQAERLLGSTSIYQRGQLGHPLAKGEVVCAAAETAFQLPPHVAGRSVSWSERRHYDTPPPFLLWPGPQWDFLSEPERSKFFDEQWTITSECDRVGYRLAGPALVLRQTQIVSEPTLVGTVQVPDSGQPIVTMRDGPTVGGYPKLGVIEPAQISWLAQCRPGQKIRFRPAK